MLWNKIFVCAFAGFIKIFCAIEANPPTPLKILPNLQFSVGFSLIFLTFIHLYILKISKKTVTETKIIPFLLVL